MKVSDTEAVHSAAAAPDPATTSRTDAPRKMRVPVHFVCPEDVLWPELKAGFATDPVPITGQRLSELSGGILNSWVVRTYYHLRLAGWDVTTGPVAQRGCINVMSPRDFGRREYRSDCFYLVPRGDSHMPMMANFTVLQNAQQRRRTDRAVVLHWPQPGILPRAPGRADRISALGYKGRLLNLEQEFQSEVFRDRLADLGVALEVDGYNGLRGAHNWNDYRSLDAVIAVRNLTRYDAAKKPASKLVNAWLAGVVPILGPEPAYAELRRDKWDYIEVRTAEEALEAVRWLNENAGDVRRFLDRADDRAAEFSEAYFTQEWADLLNGAAAERFLNWQRQPGALRRLRGIYVLAAEGLSRRIDAHKLRKGPRILAGAATVQGKPEANS